MPKQRIRGQNVVKWPEVGAKTRASPKCRDVQELASKTARQTLRNPGTIQPQGFWRESGYSSLLVEAPGLEPGSKERSTQASTSISCVLISGIGLQQARIPQPQSDFESPSVTGPKVTSKPACVTPGTDRTGGNRADVAPN